jgi:hypothetical protein
MEEIPARRRSAPPPLGRSSPVGPAELLAAARAAIARQTGEKRASSKER